MNFRRILLRRKKRRSKKNVQWKGGATETAAPLELRAVEEKVKEKRQPITNIDDINALLHHLYIAHDLAVHEDLIIKRSKYRNNDKVSTIRGAVKDLYWNLFKEQVNDDPAEYELAFELLSDIKKTLDFLIKPNMVNSLQMDDINSLLDVEQRRIKSNEKYSVKDLLKYTKYTIGVISELHLLSVKERFLKKLAKVTDLVVLFRGIVALLTNMKCDLLRLSLGNNNATEITSSYIEYEREKLNDYMEAVGESLPVTRKWLMKHVKNESQSAEQVVHEAFLELLTWSTNEPYPETLFVEVDRLKILKLKYFRIVVSCTVYFLSIGLVPLKSRRNDIIRESLTSLIVTIMNEAVTNEDVKDLAKTLAEELLSKIMAYTGNNNKDKKPKSFIELKVFAETLEKASLSDYNIRLMITRQLNDYLKQSLSMKGTFEAHFPNVLQPFKKEIRVMKLLFVRIFVHNLLICMPHYENIINCNTDGNEPIQ